MNEQLECTRRAHASTEQINGLGQTNEFMTVFSHEIRNSLGAIRMAARILSLDTSADPAMVKARVLIERQVGQMTRLVEELLDVSL
jgi:two-component system, chemotaxis family, CheB/CheR fusion protein